jgi:hypothetical protein
MRFRSFAARVCHSRAAQLSLFIVCISSSISSQMLDSTPAPPGHLPRLVGECEFGPNYAACSLWIWHGSSYSAIWQNGAVGQLTVASADAANVQFERQDSAGPVAGLTATYTAKWDGTSFNDGKIVATLKGGTNTLTWTGKATATPVLPTPQMDDSYLNWYPGQLTGYARFGGQGSFTRSFETEIYDFRIFNESPMSPGESRGFTLGYHILPPNYEKGAHYPNFSAIAAIYSDGTTFGDANVLKVMMERRMTMLTALNAIGATLCSMGQQSASINDISEALNKQQAATQKQDGEALDESGRAYSYVQKSLGSRVNSHLPANQAVRRTWDDFNKLRSGLAADPVKDASGNLVIPPVTPLTCNLP